MGNLRSVENAMRFLGYKTKIQTDLVGAAKLIIPGVGAFAKAMERLSGIKKDIQSASKEGLPIFGICLGQQLLFDSSEEYGEHVGLEILPGKVRYLPKMDSIKIPHIGWNQLVFKVGANHRSGEQVYFDHSLYTECSDPEDVLATSKHGIEFPAIVARKSILGCQFHPEKSGEVGLRFLKQFAEMSS